MNTQTPSREIHFDCPKCQRPMSGDRALLSEMITCPDCGQMFMPEIRKPRAADLPEGWTQKSSAAQFGAEQRVKAIRGQADLFTQLALFGMIAGLAAVVLAIGVGLAEQAVSWLVVSLAVSLLGAAFWSFLIAQAIHIRANTEK